MADLDEIWESLVSPIYPDLEKYQYQTLKTFGTSDWGAGLDTDLSRLFEQYVMMKTLMGRNARE